MGGLLQGLCCPLLPWPLWAPGPAQLPSFLKVVPSVFVSFPSLLLLLWLYLLSACMVTSSFSCFIIMDDNSPSHFLMAECCRTPRSAHISDTCSTCHWSASHAVPLHLHGAGTLAIPIFQMKKPRPRQLYTQDHTDSQGQGQDLNLGGRSRPCALNHGTLGVSKWCNVILATEGV